MAYILRWFGVIPETFDHDAYMGWFQSQAEQARERFGKNVVLAGSSVIRALSPATNGWTPGDVDVFMRFSGSKEQAVAYLLSLSTPDFTLAKITMPTPWPTGDTDAKEFNKSIIATGTFTRAGTVPMQLVLYHDSVNIFDMMDVKACYNLEHGFTGPHLPNVQNGRLWGMCPQWVSKYASRGFRCTRYQS